MPEETYIHNGREFYLATNKPVWPYRIREVPNGAEPRPALIDDASIIHALHALDRLERSTRPSSGLNATGKDLAAFQALGLAAHLVKDIAGWAIEHQFGKAKKGLVFTRRSLARKLHVAEDVHDHERMGRICGELKPTEARRYVLNLLYPMGRALGIPEEVIEGLEALEFGETLPIFMKVPTTKRSGLTEYRAKLAALAFIEFENEKGVRRKISTQVVLDEFAVTPAALKDWKADLRIALGTYEVDSLLVLARAFGRAVLAEAKEKDGPPGVSYLLEDKFGRPALHKAAKRYRARSRKGSKKTIADRG